MKWAKERIWREIVSEKTSAWFTFCVFMALKIQTGCSLAAVTLYSTATLYEDPLSRLPSFLLSTSLLLWPTKMTMSEYIWSRKLIFFFLIPVMYSIPRRPYSMTKNKRDTTMAAAWKLSSSSSCYYSNWIVTHIGAHSQKSSKFHTLQPPCLPTAPVIEHEI